MTKGQKIQLLTSNDNNSFFSWNGNVYESDIVRSAIRAKAKAVSKSVAKHVRNDVQGLKINPEPYMKFLLEEPNNTMSMQQLLEKTVTQLELNNNAYIFIDRDTNGFPTGLYPIIATSVQVFKNSVGDLFLQFTLKKNGQNVTFNYKDVIHLRQDFNENELFGDSNTQALAQLMEVVGTVDQGIVKALRQSNIIQWLLKYEANLKQDDIDKSVKRFTDSFMNIDSEFGGAAGIDNKVDAQRVEPKSYLPDKEFQKENSRRIYNYFGINEKIINASYTENEWIAFYELSIEPILVQLSNEFTRKLFTRKERSYGNKIMFESSNLAFASMATKLALVSFADRAIMNPNEIREIMGYAPVSHGDEYLLRKDTGTTNESTDPSKVVNK